MTKIYVLNGPNLNMLGQRLTDLYGDISLDIIEKECHEFAQHHNIDLVFDQTNHEGEFISWLHEAHSNADGVLLNPAAWTHTSIAVADALEILTIPVIECHLSIPFVREDFRKTSYLSKHVDGYIAGFGSRTYMVGLSSLLDLVHKKSLKR